MTVYLIAGSQRQNRKGRTPRERFIGALFQRALAYAEAKSQRGDLVLVLSVEHQWLRPDEAIPYPDKSLAAEFKKSREGWGAFVAGRLGRYLIGRRPTYVALCGRSYADALEPHLTRVERPFDGLRGSGDMVRWLNERLGELGAGPPAGERAEEGREP